MRIVFHLLNALQIGKSTVIVKTGHYADAMALLVEHKIASQTHTITELLSYMDNWSSRDLQFFGIVLT